MWERSDNNEVHVIEQHDSCTRRSNVGCYTGRYTTFSRVCPPAKVVHTSRGARTRDQQIKSLSLSVDLPTELGRLTWLRRVHRFNIFYTLPFLQINFRLILLLTNFSFSPHYMLSASLLSSPPPDIIPCFLILYSLVWF